MKRILLSALLTSLPMLGFADNNRINLSGEWQLSLDSINYGYSINLPGSTDQIGIGEKHIPGKPLYINRPETWQLARKNVFVGKAFYKKEFDIPADWKNKIITLSLERCLWQTKIYVNGMYVGEDHSLSVPDTFDLTGFIHPGKNIIVMEIDNSPFVNLGSWSHAYSPGIQTIWNGAIGELKLTAKEPIQLANVQCYPSVKENDIRIKGKIKNFTGNAKKGVISLILKDAKGKTILQSQQKIKSNIGETDFSCLLKPEGKLKTWDEFDPNLYSLEIGYKFGSYKGEDVVSFGVRDLETKNGKFTLNGKTIFLRGEHDPGSFPITGYPSMDKAEWKRIFNIGKEYGLNHWRFHSWCPPEAAFAAADETGIYLQPELPLFSQNWEHTQVGTDSLRDEFLFSELKRILDTYGNHPSFILMCMGNELKGDTAVLNKWVKFGREYDPRHKYAGNANLEAMRRFLSLENDEYQVAHAANVNGRRYERRMGSYYNVEKPNTTNDYSHTLGAPYDVIPVITHELGQWEVYPDFSEIEKYTGVLSPRNLEIFKSLLSQKGMADMDEKFVNASGKLAALLYKEEMERVLRTPGMDGFQILDLRDYPAQGSALVGLLNPFWESKGLITPDEFRQSCNDITVLMKMPKRTWENSETFSGEIVIPNYSENMKHNADIQLHAICGKDTIFSSTIPCKDLPQGEITSAGVIKFPLNNIEKATKMELIINVPSLGVGNSYNIWVYPKISENENPGNIIITEKADKEILKKINDGASVLLLPGNTGDVERMAFTTPFWSTLMFDYQPKTMGLYCNPSHPVFADFPTDEHSDWQWWELTANTSVARINNTPADYRPILQAIDHPGRNDKLGAIMETKIGKGKLLVCMLDINSKPEERLVARQLKRSILRYMNSPEFNPGEVSGLKEYFFEGAGKVNPVKSISFKYENSEFPASNITDGIEHTFCILPTDTENITLTCELKKDRYVTGCSIPKDMDNISDFKVFVTDNVESPGDPVISGNGKKGVYEAISWDNGFTVQKGKKGKYILIEIKKNKDVESKIYGIDMVYGD